jgi:hypothetical protein
MILRLLFGSGAAQLSETQYASVVSDMIAAFAFVMAAWAVVHARLYKRKVHRELQDAKQEYKVKLDAAREDFEKRTGIMSTPIKQELDDDLKWMLPHYKEGDRITVFAGGFAWLASNSEMKDRVLELAGENKLYLISYKTKEQVEKAFNTADAMDLFGRLKSCFRYKSGLGNSDKVVCTMIQRSPTEWKFLYKSRPESGHAFNAQVLSDTDSIRALLHILSRLTKPDHWGVKDP